MFFRSLLFILFFAFHTSTTTPIVGLTPPVWPSVWMATGSGHSLVNNRTIAVQIFYDWTRPAQVINLMREDSYSYTVMNSGTTVWRIERNNRSCCVDPDNTGVTPPRPDWLQFGNDTVYDGIFTVLEHSCYSWTKNITDTAIFSWFASVTTGIPCRLAWPNLMYTDISYYSENRDLLPKDIFTVPDYCPPEVTTPNCSVMHF